MTSSRGLPPGAQPWGRDVEAALARLKEIEDIARRICNDFGLDFSNPDRGLSTGATPGVDNPVQLKLPSLNDLDIRDAQDGDLLTFDGRRGKWVARRHDTVQLPKPVPVGDPASYYTEPVDEPEPPADGEWFAPLLDTNYILDPSFETGNMSGWFIPDFAYAPGQPSSVAKSVSYANGAGIGGGSAIKIVTTGTVDTMEMNYVFYELPPEPLGQLNVSVRCDTPVDATHTVYASVINYDADGNYLDEGYISQATVGMTRGWQNMVVDIPWQPAFNPVGVQRFLDIRIGGNYNQPWLENAEILVDHVSITANGTYFDGSLPTDSQFTYAWEGTPNASRSTKTSVRELQMPTTITLGEEFTVKGRYYPPGVVLNVRDDWWINNVEVTTDASGTFEAALTVPANTDPDNGPVSGSTGNIAVTGWGIAGLYADVTYQ